jgi:hypothetical protein
MKKWRILNTQIKIYFSANSRFTNKPVGVKPDTIALRFIVHVGCHTPLNFIIAHEPAFLKQTNPKGDTAPDRSRMRRDKKREFQGKKA